MASSRRGWKCWDYTLRFGKHSFTVSRLAVRPCCRTARETLGIARDWMRATAFSTPKSGGSVSNNSKPSRFPRSSATA
jgi:hypothetical protein